MAREYNWNVKNKLSKGYEESYFLVWRDNGVYYNELETRLVVYLQQIGLRLWVLLLQRKWSSMGYYLYKCLMLLSFLELTVFSLVHTSAIG